MRQRAIAFLVATTAAFAGSYAFAQEGPWTDRGVGPPGGSPCGVFSAISGVYTAAPGLTNGIPGTPQVGETYTISITGPGTGSFRLVGDPGGAITFAGPGTVPATLSYTFVNPPPPGNFGVGFFFDAGAGSVTVGASCSVISVPATNRWGATLLLALAGLAGLAALYLRRKPA